MAMPMSETSYNQTQVWGFSAMENSSVICYAPSMITTAGVWQDDDPLNFSLPLFILQLIIIVVTNRVVVFLLKPFHQPKIVAEILSGILIGPIGFGRIPLFSETVFPLRSVMVLQTMANVGVLYFLFLIGIEMDFSLIKYASKEALNIAFAATLFPILTSFPTFLLTYKAQFDRRSFSQLFIFSLCTSVTSSPMLNRILADGKLLSSDIGRLLMTSSTINDIVIWILFAITTIVVEENQVKNPKIFGLLEVHVSHALLATFYVVLFISVCIFVIHPLMKWIIKHTPEGESFSEFYISLILAGVMISGFITDVIGTHYVFGAFVFGLTIPNEPLGTALIEKLEEFVTTLLFPIFFAVCGLKVEVEYTMPDYNQIVCTFLLSIGKIICTSHVALLQHMSLREGLSLGVFLNAGCFMELVILTVAVDKKVLPSKPLGMFMIISVIMTSIAVPTAFMIYKHKAHEVKYQKKAYRRKTIQLSKAKGDSELRICVCIHTHRNVPTIINLLEASNPTKSSPICIYVLHLVELTGRVTATLIVHNSTKYGRCGNDRIHAKSEHIISAFEFYERQSQNVVVLSLTAISPYSTMHEDICNLVEDKAITFIIVPFHKQQTVDGGMEVTNPAFRNINQNILANAPCSVGILIDRGFSGFNQILGSDDSHEIVVLFFGGSDDREALSYAWRMAEQPYVNLTIIRFIPGDHSGEQTLFTKKSKSLKMVIDYEREKRLDDDIISEFRSKSKSNDTITYRETTVNNGEETVTSIRSMDDIYDLYIVGREQSKVSSLISGLSEWSECPELGPIGDFLASPDFSAKMSVLVVQQYVEDEIKELEYFTK